MACSPRTLRTDIWGCGVDKLPGTFLDKECFFVLGPHLQWNCWAGETGTLGGSGQPVRHWRSGHFSVLDCLPATGKLSGRILLPSAWPAQAFILCHCVEQQCCVACGPRDLLSSEAVEGKSVLTLCGGEGESSLGPLLGCQGL